MNYPSIFYFSFFSKTGCESYVVNSICCLINKDNFSLNRGFLFGLIFILVVNYSSWRLSVSLLLGFRMKLSIYVKKG